MKSDELTSQNDRFESVRTRTAMLRKVLGSDQIKGRLKFCRLRVLNFLILQEKYWLPADNELAD